MTRHPKETIVVAISSTALFDLSSILVCKRKLDGYAFEVYQRKLRRILLQPGIAFDLATKLLAANAVDETLPKIEIGKFSHRFFCTDFSVKQYGLMLEDDNKATPENGEPNIRRSIYRTDLFLSDNPEDLKTYEDHGYLTALIHKSDEGTVVNLNSTNVDLIHRIKPIIHLLPVVQ